MKAAILTSLLALCGAFAAHAAAPSQPARVAATATANEIVMYVMPGCGYCERARGYLSQRGLAWREVDVTTSQDGAAEFERRGGQGTPLFVIDGKTVHGFNAERMDAVLAAKP